MNVQRLVVSVVLVVAVVSAWFVTTAFDLVPTVILPAPAATWHALTSVASAGTDLRSAIGSTLGTIAIAFGLAVAAGVPAGLLIGRSRLLSEAYEPVVANLTAVPLIVLYPMLAGALGVTSVPKIVVGFIAAVLPIVLAASAAARTVDRTLLTAITSMGASRMRRFGSLIGPATLPGVMAGVRTGLGLCSVTVVAAEYIASLDGLGYRLAETSESLQTPELFAYIIVTLVVMGVLNVVLAGLHKLIDKGVTR